MAYRFEGVVVLDPKLHSGLWLIGRERSGHEHSHWHVVQRRRNPGVNGSFLWNPFGVESKNYASVDQAQKRCVVLFAKDQFEGHGDRTPKLPLLFFVQFQKDGLGILARFRLDGPNIRVGVPIDI